MQIRVLSQQISQEASLNYEDRGDFILIKDRVLLSPGNWNGLEFKKEEIQKAFQLTDWSDKENFAFIYDHDEKAINWLGNVVNIRVLEDGTMLGDLEIFDKEFGTKLTKGQAKLGISAKVLGIENDSGEFVDFTFNNFSAVYNPACKKAYINLAEDKINSRVEELEKRVEKLEGETGSSQSAGAPIGDSVTNSEVKYGDEMEKCPDCGEMIPKEKMDDHKKVHNTKEEMKNSDLTIIQVKGGLNSVTMSEKENLTVEENAAVELKQEEVVESATPVVSEADLSSKLDKALALLESFGARIAKLEEAKTETLSEKKVELSAKEEPKVMSVAQMSKKTHKLLGNEYSAGEHKLAEVLLRNATAN